VDVPAVDLDMRVEVVRRDEFVGEEAAVQHEAFTAVAVVDARIRGREVTHGAGEQGRQRRFAGRRLGRHHVGGEHIEVARRERQQSRHGSEHAAAAIPAGARRNQHVSHGWMSSGQNVRLRRTV